jgi:hypothetical protein
MFQQLFTGVFFFCNFEGLILGTLVSFLLTSWRTRLTWTDWTVVLLLNLPTALFSRSSVESLLMGRCSSTFCFWMMFGGASFGIGLPLGLSCAKWVIAARESDH